MKRGPDWPYLTKGKSLKGPKSLFRPLLWVPSLMIHLLSDRRVVESVVIRADEYNVEIR